MLSPSSQHSDTLLATPFTAAAHADDGKSHILLAASGSVATIKLPLIARALSAYTNVSIRIILTGCAAQFLAGQSAEQPTVQSLLDIRHVEGVYRDEDEWSVPWTRGQSILHIEMRRWADVLVVAPLSANTLAKMSIGMADNLLLSVIRAWDTSGEVEAHGKRKLILVAPAMNTAMWRHPITKKQIKVLEEEWGPGGGESDGWVRVLRPMKKELACGDVGDGAMLDWKDIVKSVEQTLGLHDNTRNNLP